MPPIRLADGCRAAAVAAKDEGNKLFKQGQYRASIDKYSEAISLDRQVGPGPGLALPGGGGSSSSAAGAGRVP